MSFRWSKTVDSPGDAFLAPSEGFSNVQLPLADLMEFSDAGFLEYRRQMTEAGLVAEVCSRLFPPDVVVTGQGFNLYVWVEYLKNAMARVAELGCTRLAWSNGRSRILPWEENVDEMKEQAMQFLFMVCDVAQTYDMSVVIEPLSSERTNFLTSMEETDSFVRQIGKENLSSMVSLRDLAAIGLSPQSLHQWKHRISHVLIENPERSTTLRTAPSQDDSFDYKPFLDGLRDIDYQGLIALPSDATSTTLQFCISL